MTRSGGYDVDAIPDSAEMRRFSRQALDQQLQMLIDARVEIIAYACTSATLADGPDYDRNSVPKSQKLPAVTTAGRWSRLFAISREAGCVYALRTRAGA